MIHDDKGRDGLDELQVFVQILDQQRNALGASSCTFYIADPMSPDALRLIAMPGVKIREPMHGLVLPYTSLERVAGKAGDATALETYFPDAQSDSALQDYPVVDTSAPLIFGNFVRREAVRSCARLRKMAHNKIEAVMWVNFENPRDFPEAFRERLRTVFQHACKLAKRIPQLIRAGLHESGELKSISRSVHILQSITQLTTVGQPLEWYLDHILSGVFAAFGLKEHGVGTIHLFDPTTRQLKLKGEKGKVGHRDATTLDVRDLKGIVSWVALHKRALLVEDLRHSVFQDIYIPVLDKARSELAVPMLSGDDLLGVVNLESSRKGFFTAEGVRALWFAANQAAVACRLVQNVERSEELLRIAYHAVVEAPAGKGIDSSADGCLSKLAVLARNWVGAAHCDIWHYDADKRQFVDSGATYRQANAPPRPDGWTYFVQRASVPTWLSAIKSTTDFSAAYWDSSSHEWKGTSPPGLHPPQHVNHAILKLGVGSELGIPLYSNRRCIGVAWLKFHSAKQRPPSPEIDRFIDGFAAHAGLVIDLFDRHRQQSHRQRFLQDLEASLFKIGKLTFPGINGFVFRLPHGELGGDFHAFQQIGESQTGILIGDAESHGLQGAMNMLPIMTTFGVVAKESTSAKHTLLRLVQICEQRSIRGTALYFTIKAETDKAVLFLSAAGHPALIIITRAGMKHLPENEGPANRGGLGLSLGDLILAEEYHELPLDSVVVAYTDGVAEAGIPPLTKQGVASLALAHFHESPEKIATAIRDAADNKVGGEFDDDLTIMVLKIIPHCPAT